ncbi:MAG: secretion protein HlyD [Acidobacteria bacterium]|nr:MAG: secretion protein HlyD [Acidobacteriota bacterium]
MKRLILPVIGVLAALWATFSVARTQPKRERTEPAAPPPVSDFPSTVAAVGLVEASTENISVGTPLAGVVTRVFVTAGQTVRSGDPLFELDTRHLRADLAVREQAVGVAQARAAVAEARLSDLRRQYEFAEQVKDRRAISAEEVSRRRSAVETAEAEVGEARAQLSAARAQARATTVEIERSTVRAPIDAEVLQVKLRVGEFAPAGVAPVPLVLLGRSKPLHVRVDVDEHEGWRVRPGAAATGHLRGNAQMKTPLRFVRFEPFVVPKRSLTGDSTERVDTRVLQVIYRVEREDLPLFVGQQLDVFIDAQPAGGAGR